MFWWQSTLVGSLLVLTHQKWGVESCNENQFRCNSGDCIDEWNRCNLEWNCNDGSDEHDCEMTFTPMTSGQGYSVEIPQYTERYHGIEFLMCAEKLCSVITVWSVNSEGALGRRTCTSCDMLGSYSSCKSSCRVVSQTNEVEFSASKLTFQAFRNSSTLMVWLAGHLGQAVTVPLNGGTRLGVRPHWWHNKMNVHIKALPSLSHCRDVEFRCISGQCISKQEMCDGRKSCDDGSDESPSLCGGATQLRPGEQISGEFTTSTARTIFQLCDYSYCGQIVVTGVRKNGRLIFHTGRECDLQGEHCINDYGHNSVSTGTDDFKVGTIERFRVQNQNSLMVLFFGDNFDRAAEVPVEASSRNFSVRLDTNERLKVQFTEITPMELVERELVKVDNKYVFSSQLCEPVLCTEKNISSLANVVCKYKEKICLVNAHTDSLPTIQETQIVSPNRPRRTPPTPRYQTTTPRQFLEEVEEPISLFAVKAHYEHQRCFWEDGNFQLSERGRRGQSRMPSHQKIERCSGDPSLARHHIIPYNVLRALFSTAVVAHMRFQHDGIAAVGSVFPLTELLIELAGMVTPENTGYREEELQCARHSALLARQNDNPTFLRPLNGYLFFWMVSNIVVGPAPQLRGDDPKSEFDEPLHRLLEENDTLHYWAIDGLHSAIQRYMEVIRPYIVGLEVPANARDIYRSHFMLLDSIRLLVLFGMDVHSRLTQFCPDHWSASGSNYRVHQTSTTQPPPPACWPSDVVCGVMGKML